MEFEDDETSTQEHSFRAEGTLDADATRALVCRDFQYCRSDKMREGYSQELEEGKQLVEEARGKLEAWFARKLDDVDIVGPERAVYDEILRDVESAFVVLNGKMKAVKTATAVNQEFQVSGMELGGAAGHLISSSGKWPSNFQRDMLRKCAPSQVPVTKLQVPVNAKGMLKKRSLPVVLPHEVFPWLVKQGIIPLNDTAEIGEFWSHARTAGMPTMGATDSHIPLYLWGDDARFTETHEDKLVVVAFGRVLETSKNALETVWPLFLYQQVVASFNILFEQGVMVETPSGERKRVFAAVVQFQGDWKWHKAARH
ncbi:unnamed protein product [Symbiodinium sp. CCMP2592]|nr:unnamed protein product [Symbiodinium sp. CCMP2592]